MLRCPVTTLTSRALVLDLLTIGQSCKETESVGRVRDAGVGRGKSTGVGQGREGWVVGSDYNMIRPSLQLEAGLNRVGLGRAAGPGAPLTLPLNYTEDKLLTYSKAHS